MQDVQGLLDALALVEGGGADGQDAGAGALAPVLGVDVVGKSV